MFWTAYVVLDYSIKHCDGFLTNYFKHTFDYYLVNRKVLKRRSGNSPFFIQNAALLCAESYPAILFWILYSCCLILTNRYVFIVLSLFF